MWWEVSFSSIPSVIPVYSLCLLVDSLEGLAQSLLANQCSFEEQTIVHPTTAVLVDMATKIVRNRDKESVRVSLLVIAWRVGWGSGQSSSSPDKVA